MRRLTTVLSSACVGAIATGFDLLLLAVLVDGLGLAPRAANLPALLGGVLAQFVGNKVFAFRDRSPAWVRQGLWFGLVEAGALSLNALLFDRLIAVFALPYLGARVLGSALVYFGFSLPLWSRIFRAPKPAEVPS